MSQDNRHILWAPEDHPSTELLRQYQEDTLAPALSHQLERHLLDCDLCSDVLEGMVVSDAGKTRSALRHINQHIAAKTRKKKRKPMPVYLTDWRVAAGLLLVLCSTLLVFYYNYREIRQQEQSMASDSDKAIQESMDLGETQAAPEKMADAVPDTVRETIAATVPATARSKRLIFVPPQVRVQEQEEISLDTEQSESEAEGILAETPAVTESLPSEEALTSIAYPDRNAFVPETTSVVKALQGKAGGVKLRRANSVSLKQVQGQVLSPDGQPLPGVAVTVKGTSTGVATDAHGNFSLSLPVDKATLAFTYIGYEREEKTLDANTQHLTVNLQENTSSLSEVVVTGYGTTKAKPPVVVAPKPGIGAKAYKKYLQENIRYTPDSEKGRVVVQAMVSPSGAMQNMRVIKSLCPSCDEEAIRLIKEGPAWKPATQNGSSIAQEVRIVVRFSPENKK